MAEAFVIMQIGNPDLDRVYHEVMVHALSACGMSAVRVDKHNQGGLLKSEIVGFIQRADIVLADLTNERPNCYLEVGYAMGLGKSRNLILMAREDHLQESPNHQHGGPKVHFDLAGYDILFWHPDQLEEFGRELERRIRRRQAILGPPAATSTALWNDEWTAAQREAALAGLAKAGRAAFMEARFALLHPKPNKTHRELEAAARDSTISTFGWPIAVYFLDPPEWRPRPRAEGIVAEIASDRGTYDYWALRRDADFYWVGSLFEDVRNPGMIFFNTRIVRVTETLLYCRRLYERLDVEPSSLVHIAVRHWGIAGRQIVSSEPAPLLRLQSPCAENESEVVLATSLQQIESNLIGLVRQILDPLFVLFDYFEVQDQRYETIVNSFMEGKVL